jgi:hypothetical protein
MSCHLESPENLPTNCHMSHWKKTIHLFDTAFNHSLFQTLELFLTKTGRFVLSKKGAAEACRGVTKSKKIWANLGPQIDNYYKLQMTVSNTQMETSHRTTLLNTLRKRL